MAGEKLTDIPKIVTDVAPDDLVYMVDISDTTDDPAGSSAQSPVSSIAGKVLLQRITLSSAGEFDFDNIPQDYERLIIQGRIRGVTASASEAGRLFLNGDTVDANYSFQQLVNNNETGVFTKGNSAFCGAPPAGNSPAGSFGAITLTIEGYRDSGLKSFEASFGSYQNTDNHRQGVVIVTSKTITTAISRLQIRSFVYPSDGYIGTLSLYGER